MSITDDERDDLAAMLPFLANGSLSEDERTKLEAAIESDPELKAEFEDIQGLAGRLKSDFADLDFDAHSVNPERLGKLLDVIDEKPKRPSPVRQPVNKKQRKPFFAQGGDRALDWVWNPISTGLAAAAFTAFAMIVMLPTPSPTGPIIGLSGEDNSPKHDGPSVLLQISDTAQWGSLEALFIELDLEIISGPRNGFVTLVSKNKDADVTEITDKLSQNELIRLALLQEK